MFDEYINPYESQTNKKVDFKLNMKKMSFSTPKLNGINFNEANTFSPRHPNRARHISMVNNGKPFSYIYPNYTDKMEITNRHRLDSTLRSRSRSYSDFSRLVPRLSVNNNFEPEVNSSIGPAGTTVIVHVHQNGPAKNEIWSKNRIYEHLNAYNDNEHESVNKPLRNKESLPNRGPVSDPKIKNADEKHTQKQTSQLFQQQKYRNRQLSEKNIKHMDHLRKSSSCADLIDHLHTRKGQKNYGNISPLKILRTNNNTDEDFHLSKEHIYEEIDESELKLTKYNKNERTPPMIKKVTFLLPRDYMIREDDAKYKKKIIPILFWGIAEVLIQLREKSEDYRRTIAHMSCRSVQLNYTSYSLKFLGKVDTSRKGEQMYLVIGEESFEIRDSDGLLITNHRPKDVSVIVNNEKEPNLVTFIGK